MSEKDTLPVTSNLISASAGTGKTYQLSSRFISLLALGYPPERLVALTFTRNAAGEFQDRILTDLAKGAADEAGATELRERIGRTCSGESGMVALCQVLDRERLASFDCAFFKGLLKKVIGSLSKMQLSTIDSYFNRLVSAHSLELGYSSIQLLSDVELRKVKRRALMSLLLCEEEGDDESLQVLLKDTESLAKRENGTLEVLAKNTGDFHTMFKEVDKEAWGRYGEFPHLESIVKHLECMPAAQQADELARMVDDLCCKVAAMMKDVEPSMHKTTYKSLTKLVGNRGAGATDGVVKFMYPAQVDERLLRLRDKVRELVEAAETAPEQLPAEELARFRDEIARLMDAAEYDKRGLIEDLFDKCAKKKTKRTNYRSKLDSILGLGGTDPYAELRQASALLRDTALMVPTILKTRRVRSLMERYDQIYDEDVRGAGKLVFDDITREVPHLLDKTDERNIAYRLDSSADHWMLDEFQDTSPAQWKALSPLLEQLRDDVRDAGLHASRSLFVVGDEKQSIYGFRGASPELFGHLQRSDDWKDVLEKSLLNASQRSAATIMGPMPSSGAPADSASERSGFVNALFSALPDAMGTVMEHFDFSGFCRHSISPRMADARGYVSIRTLQSIGEANAADAEEPEGQAEGAGDESALQIMCKHINQLLGPENIDFSSPKRQLTAAILVRTNRDVLTVYKWFSENSDIPVLPMGSVKVSQASFLGELLLHLYKWLLHPGNDYCRSLVQNSPLNVLKAPGCTVMEEWGNLRKMVEDQGVSAVLRRVTEGLDGIGNDAIYREWVNAAAAFDVEGGDLEAWILAMENMEVKMVPPKSYVHVLTYHKSKGAEYDVVFLPLSGCKSMVSTDKFLYAREESIHDGLSRTDSILLAPPAVDAKVPESPYNRMFMRWKARMLGEAVNVLYVAATRAKYANYILVNDKAQDGTYSRMIMGCNLQPEWGDSQWYADNAFKERPESAPPAVPDLETGGVPRRRKVSPSSIGHAAPAAQPVAAQQARHVEAARAAAAEYGTAVHACFERLEWLEPNAPLPLDGEEGDAAAAVREALQNPEVAAVFHCPSPHARVYNEQDIDYLDERNAGTAEAPVMEKVWVSGIIDRLVVEYADDNVTPVSAHVYDYKTNALRGDKAAHADYLLTEYAGQMQAYCTAVARALGLDRSRVSATLVAVPHKAAGQSCLVPCC